MRLRTVSRGLALSYTHEVGALLRRARTVRGWSLQEVERRSEGRLKAAVVGSYERGDRNISAARLLELARFYEVAPASLLPSKHGAPQVVRANEGIVVDLQALEAAGERFRRIRRYLDAIRQQRGDYTRRVLSIRGDDLRALAVLHETSSSALIDELRATGVLHE